MNRLIPGLLACTVLAGCAAQTTTTGTTTTQSPAQVATATLQDVNLIAVGFSNALPALAHDPAIPAATLAKLEAITYQIQAATGALSVGMSKVSAQPTVLQIETLVNQVVAIAAGLPLPPAIAAVFQAGAVLLPIIEASVGLMHPAAMVPAAMTPAQARLVLEAETAR